MNTWAHTGTGLRASGSSILPKHPLKALWNSLSNSVQNTSLKPPIYRLQETSKNAKIRTLAGERPDGFLRYPFRNNVILSLSNSRLDVRKVFAKSFPCSNGTLEYSELQDIIRTCCHVFWTSCKDFLNSVDFWKQTHCWILIDLAPGRCCSGVRTSSMFICKTLRGVRTHSKARPDGWLGTGWFDLVFAMDSSWISSRRLWTVNV